MSVFVVVLLFFILFFPLLESACMPTRCGKDGPIIKSPFRHKHRQPAEYCSYYPGFEVDCNDQNETVLVLPVSVNVTVKKIDYVHHKLQIYDPQECILRKLLNLNLSDSPFHFLHRYLDDYVLFNCSASNSMFSVSNSMFPWPDDPTYQLYSMFSCPDDPTYQLYPIPSASRLDYIHFTSCTRIHEISSVPWDIFRKRDLHLKWFEPACGGCEPGDTKGALIASAASICILPVMALALLFLLYNSYKTGRKNQSNIERFLEDYRALKPTRFSYSDIKRITNRFGEILGEGGYGIVYKGKLSNEIQVAVKVLNSSNRIGEEFVNEVGIIGTIHHVNVVRLVGFCAEGLRRALVYEFLPNESLEKFIFQTGPTKRNSLGWAKLQDIALGIAKGIEYLHQGCDQQILHFDIKPHNILLDHNLNPKICDFGLAKLCSKEKSAVSMTAARGTMGYIAPEVLSRTFGRVSYKSDVYSFGMLLLEMVGGRKNSDERANNSQIYFPQWIYNQLNTGEYVWTHVEEGDHEDGNIAKKLTIVGLWCIQWCPTDCPSMKAVVQMLEGNVDDLTHPPNPFPSANATNVIARIQERRYQTELALVEE